MGCLPIGSSVRAWTLRMRPHGLRDIIPCVQACTRWGPSVHAWTDGVSVLGWRHITPSMQAPSLEPMGLLPVGDRDASHRTKQFRLISKRARLNPPCCIPWGMGLHPIRPSAHAWTPPCARLNAREAERSSDPESPFLSWKCAPARTLVVPSNEDTCARTARDTSTSKSVVSLSRSSILRSRFRGPAVRVTEVGRPASRRCATTTFDCVDRAGCACFHPQQFHTYVAPSTRHPRGARSHEDHIANVDTATGSQRIVW